MEVYFYGVFFCAVAWLVLHRFAPLYDEATLERLTERARRKRLLLDMPEAFLNGEIFLAYQPKLRLRTNDVDGVEALVRWNHPSFGAVERQLLIDVAEESGKIRELSIWVLRRALSDQARLKRFGREISVHINISATLLTDDDFVREVCTLVGPTTGMIGLEITETAFIENSPIALTNLGRMIQEGLSISIDDYGSGMSSLAYLKELPAKELKIDKMFISGMTVSHRDPLIVRSTIDLAHALGLSVVAEGVESLATLALLRVMGCDLAQGFLISPPLTIDLLENYLAEGDYRSFLSTATASLSQPASFWSRTKRDDATPFEPAVATG
jgi:EAL domain-containing protein (putative c-di-GMP-specific phosphodiesterase class I)